MKRILRIILISLLALTPLFWYGVYMIGSNHVNNLVNEYMYSKYGQEIDQLEKQMDKIQEEYLEGSGSSMEVFGATKKYGDILLAIKGKAQAEFYHENKGLKGSVE